MVAGDSPAVAAAATDQAGMTDKKPKTVSATLATATCALLGAAPAAPVQAQEEPDWNFDTALLYYGEDGERVQDISLSILAVRNFVDERKLTLGLGIDSLTGATPIGAIPYSGTPDFYEPVGIAGQDNAS